MLYAVHGFHSPSEMSQAHSNVNVTGTSAGLWRGSVLVISVNNLEYQQELFLHVCSSGNHASCFGIASSFLQSQ